MLISNDQQLLARCLCVVEEWELSMDIDELAKIQGQIANCRKLADQFPSETARELLWVVEYTEVLLRALDRMENAPLLTRSGRRASEQDHVPSRDKGA
jgi:hypothetical protein